MWDLYENVGIWSSDYPHHDAEDAWEALELMERHKAPSDVQVKLLGENARRLYGIDHVLVVKERTEEYEPLAGSLFFDLQVLVKPCGSDGAEFAKVSLKLVSLARSRSRSITRDLIEVLAVDVPEAFEGPRGADRESVEGILVPREKDCAFLEDAASDVEGELLEDGEVQIGVREVLQALVAGSEIGARL